MKKLLSMDSYLDHVCKKYYPQTVDSTIYEAYPQTVDSTIYEAYAGHQVIGMVKK